MTSVSTSILANKRPTSDQQATTNKNVKNEKNEKNTICENFLSFPEDSVKYQKKRFQKPTAEELDSYAKEIGFIGFNPQVFLDFYDSKGWLIGKTPMKDWKAAVRTWKRNNYSSGSNLGVGGVPPAGENVRVKWEEEQRRLKNAAAKTNA